MYVCLYICMYVFTAAVDMPSPSSCKYVLRSFELAACLVFFPVLPYNMSLQQPLTLQLNAIGDDNVLSTKDVMEGLKDVVSVDNVKCVTQRARAFGSLHLVIKLHVTMCLCVVWH